MLRPGHILALCAIALLTIGVVMVNSALMKVSAVSAPGQPVSGITLQSVLQSPQTLHMGLALAAMVGAGFLPLRQIAGALEDRLSRLGLVPLIFGVLAMLCLLVLCYVPGLAKPANNSQRWIKLPLFGQMQPSELVKWGFVAIMAWYASARAALMPKFWVGLVPALAAVLIVAAGVAKEDLGTGVLIASTACLVLIAGGARLTHFLLFVPFAVAGVVGAILTSPYRINRIISFIDPYADPQGTGYHIIQSLVAISNGEVFGRGLGFGLQKLGFLPEDQTDFLFAVICEELGVAGALVIAALFGGIVWSGMIIACREPSRLLRLFALGVIGTVGLQAIINLAVVTGLGPTKGIALPLVSAGGTGWIFTALCLGLVIAIDRSHAAATEPGRPAHTPARVPVEALAV
jgi:cell division protein FtsW